MLGGTSAGLFELTGGVLTAAEVAIGGTKGATFRHTGGANRVQGRLDVGTSGKGVYDIADTALLNAKDVRIGNSTSGNGLFAQRGGTVDVISLVVRATGRYEFTGGTFRTSGLHLNGTFDFLGTEMAWTADDLILHVDLGGFANAENVTLTLGPRSLLLLPAGVTSLAGFASVTSAGLTHTVGSTLVVPEGGGFSGVGTIADRVECAGEIAAPANGALNLQNGLALGSGGAADLGFGKLTVEGGASTVGAATLHAGAAAVGLAQTATLAVTSAAASVALDSLTIGPYGAVDVAPGADFTVGGLALSAGGTLATGGGCLHLTTFSSAGTIDLADGGLVIDYAGASPLASVWAQILAACNGGAWDGIGITSCTAAADTEGLFAIGVIDNADPILGGRTEFMGEAVGPNCVLVRLTYAGDADLDGAVTSDDYDVIDNAFVFGVPAGTAQGWWRGDFNGDGLVDADDYDLIDNAFVFGGEPLGGRPAPVPEPATLTLVALGGLALCSRARRRCA